MIQLPSDNAETAAKEVKPALDALGKWAKDNYVVISAEKTQAMVISVDPKDRKCQPTLFLNHQKIKYSKKLTIPRTTIDSQLRFTDQMKMAKAKLIRRNNMLTSLGGRDWRLTGADIRRLYNSYVRPGGAYAVEV